MSAGPDSRTWRKFLRFSVRALLVVVLVIAAGLGWLVRGARIQREAVAAIKQARGLVKYDWEQKSGNLMPPGKPPEPRWLVDMIGVDYFGHVTEVALPASSKSTDKLMAQVERLNQVERLIFDGTPISDSDLAMLKGLRNLYYLSLIVTPVSDAGLVHLEGLTKLSYLDLRGTKVTDAGLAHLEAAQLNWLIAQHTRISGAGLVHLHKMTNLNFLDLRDTGAQRLPDWFI